MHLFFIFSKEAFKFTYPNNMYHSFYFLEYIIITSKVEKDKFIHNPTKRNFI